MRNAPLRVLLVEDVPAQVRLVREYLAEVASGSVVLEHTERLQAALARLEADDVDVLLLDLDLPDSGGMSTLETAHRRFPALPIVVFTSVNDEELGDRLVQAGAQDYLVKGETGGTLLFRTLRHAVERKRTLEELRQERNLLDRASSAGRVALWEWDFASDALVWRGAASSWFQSGSGYPPGTRGDWEARIHADDRPMIAEAFRRHLDEGREFDLTYRVLRDDGLHTWWHEVGSVQRDARGAATGMAGVCIDVTERKRLESERERLLHRLETAVKEIETLSGLLPICSWCKKVRDDKGYWSDLENYLASHAITRFSHGLCPECARHHFPDLKLDGDPDETDEDGISGGHA